ncbi:glycoside hydrolase family 3 N-terminal domain-containing protein [Flavobacterium orientale]|uniref:beta-N-acetylhexosaminidase n=1 Tax=Flavobacterium orientale TaxID=1756020 RepID=A0A916Y9Z5_9FLAO|nr:glycoside hydrolase family 3 N-terminal domain-containing protein [Flavobacterium orientale]GGD36112.1 beta-N-acetylglucosaminidase [Flavobacterium orientale]
MKYRILIFLLAIIYVLLSVEDFEAKKVVAVHEEVLQKSFSATVPEKVKEEKITYFETTDAQKKWVDSVYKSMTLDEKVGQLFMVAAYSNKDSAHVESIDKLIEDHKIGGLIFFQGGPVRQAKLTNRFQAKSKLPLFIGIDAEWGLSMRLDSTYRYPWNMTLGAVQDMKLIEKLGAQMGEQSKRMGIHFNFAPVLDINTNPKNPIIGNRSFGEDKENVTDRALALMKGLQSQGVFATGKHFPGHGDTDKDSHYTLPTISFNKERIDDVELYPYRKLINKGLASVMVAHLNVPSLEKRSNYPSSISYNIVTNILQKELDFEGLIFTDALNMKGASSFKKPGDIDLEAFLAGNDILLFPENVPVAITKIKEALQTGTLTEKRLEFSVRKILEYKFKAGLHSYQPISLLNLHSEINTMEYDALQYDLYQEAVTVLKNKDEILPIKNLERQKIAYVKLGDDIHSPFVETLSQYAEITEVTDSSLLGITTKLKEFSTVIIGFHKADGAWKNHDFKENELVWLYEIARTNKVILDVFAKPYSLLQLTTTENIEAIVVSYQNNPIAHSVSGQLIFGSIDSKGKLPVSINEDFAVNHGIQLKKNNRLGFGVPENVGMNSLILSRIDLIAQDAIDKRMAPGMQVLVARKGKVIYQKAFGHHNYDKRTEVKNTDIYDVASLTKIMATLPAMMQLYERGLVNMDTKLGEMLPVFKGTDKEKINFKDFLSHYARLQPWIPFYKTTLDANKKPLDNYYRKSYSNDFSLQVAENLYMRNDYRDTILKIIADSKLLPKREYKYSDFTFIVLRDYIEKTTGKTLDVLVQENFYQSIGAHYTMYNPLRKFDMSVIPPTEDDTYFRNQRIQGYVHDMGAAMNGGVDGHAGIFSNAMDMAKMMQLYLQKGTYGGKTYFSKKTFEDFNTCYFCSEGNRRGLGFDKPQLGTAGPTCGCASMTSFGHTGFTGTMAWADPEQEIVYIFLSNRTFPDSNAPNNLSKNNVRERIQQVIYDAIEK